jgi:4-hydroxy-tetrahydrodipicolinate synthase
MAKELKGIVAAMVTPFKQDESLDEDALRAVARFLIAKGVHGLFPAGSQGEFYALSEDEQHRVLDITLEAAGGDVFVVAHAGAITTRQAVSLARYAERAGADAITAITPFYISPSQDELYAYYTEIAAAVSLPVLAYTNPGRTGVNLLPATAARLARDVPNFCGIKDSAGDLTQFAEYLRLCPSGFRAFVGRDSIIYAALTYGGVGAVAATANVMPDLIVGIYDAVIAGDHERALALQRKLTPLRIAFGLGTFPVVIKEAMRLIGLPGGFTRRPVGPLSPAVRNQLRQVLAEIGLLEGTEG